MVYLHLSGMQKFPYLIEAFVMETVCLKPYVQVMGKFFIFTGLSKSNVEAKIGRAAFLLTEIKTSTLILQGPLIKN